jgi:hypothetical protein
MVGGFSGQGSALDVRTREIRLLVMSLEPASKSATLALTVKRVRLVDASPFYALSYVCGPDKPTRPVIVNSERVNLRLSIWNFLHTIRKYFCQPVGCSDSTIQIWADCLCIDQDNIEERNAQVSMMGDIYKAADKVYSWLGDTSDQETNILSVIKGESRDHSDDGWEMVSSWQDRNDLYRCIGIIASNPYWSRMWVKQEVLLAKDVWIFLGSETANWKTILKIAYECQSLSYGRRHSEPTYSSFEMTDREEHAMTSLLELRAHGSVEFQLPHLVSKFYPALCLDPRDRLFSIVSLLDPASRSDIVVDYAKPLLQILLETYPYWTGERRSIFLIEGLKRQVPVYDIQSFCSQMLRLLPGDELRALYVSNQARQHLAADAIFKTSTLLEIEAVQSLATMRSEGLPSSTCLGITTSDTCYGASGFAVSVQVKETLPGRPAHRRHFFMYFQDMPKVGDYITRMASKVLLVRSFGSVQEDKGVRRSLEVVSTGTDFSISPIPLQDVESQRLANWSKYQILDAKYELVEPELKPNSSHSQNGVHIGCLQVLCNAAAIVAILAESGMVEANVWPGMHHHHLV